MYLSIITVTYNCVKTIEKTVLSVLSQNTDDIEYIIIDGGSTDGTLDVLNRYSSSFSHFIIEPDDGIYDAMNKGIALASGDYIAFINGDDWYEDDALLFVVNRINESRADVYYGNVIRYFGGKTEKWIPGGIEELNWHLPFGHQGVFVKRTEIRFDTSYKIAADYKMMLKLYDAGMRFEYMPFDVACFSMGGISNKNEYNTLTETVDIAANRLIDYRGDKRKFYLERIIDIYVENEFWHGLNMDKGNLDFGGYIVSQLKHPQRMICFGCGNMAKRFLDCISQMDCYILYFVDNNNDTNYMDYDVKLPRVLIGETDADIVICSFLYCEEMVIQLKKLSLHSSVNILSFKSIMKSYLQLKRNEFTRIGMDRIPSLKRAISMI